MVNQNRIITVQNIPITISTAEMEDYICITDIAVAKSDNLRAADIIKPKLFHQIRNVKSKIILIN